MAKMNLNEVPMPKQSPEDRKNNYDEVALGYSAEQALAEAKRCIQCKKPTCIDGCPVEIDIPGFILAIQEDDMPSAVKTLKDKNNLPGICGRVCPQETQCQETCVLAKKGAPVSVGRLERYVADWEMAQSDSVAPQESPAKTGKKVAVVGAGPAGLTAAGDLTRMGHEVVIFEALHSSGGVLTYGIPEFRMPKRIVQAETDYVRSLGAELRLNWIVGKTSTVDDLFGDGFDAVFLGTGAGLPMFLNIPGENLNGIYSANALLTRINLMKAYLYPDYDTDIDELGEYVAVIGGGNVAMDAARCSLRLGAKKVYIIYRRSKAELPARAEEVENAEEEGIIFKFLTNPKRFVGNGIGDLVAMECDEMELGEPDESGRRRPIVKPDSEFTIPIDTAVVAIGTTPNPLVPSTTEGLETGKRGIVIADGDTGLTKKPKVWAGGDVTTGSATVISAMGAAKRAAVSIDAYLRGET